MKATIFEIWPVGHMFFCVGWTGWPPPIEHGCLLLVFFYYFLLFFRCFMILIYHLLPICWSDPESNKYYVIGFMMV